MADCFKDETNKWVECAPVVRLEQLLRETYDEHHEHELVAGKDENWERWYANYMLPKLVAMAREGVFK